MMSAIIPHILAMGAGGPISAKSFQRSRCGEEFDEYVYRAVSAPFPFSPTGAASRELGELLEGRRFKLHYHGNWREGKVVSWKQYNPNPNTMETCWTVLVQLDTVEVGDEVELRVAGAVCSNDSNQDGTIRMETSTGDKNSVIVKPSEGVTLSPRMKLQVHRMNVEGGGTVKLLSNMATTNDQEERPLLSLEWLEPASPSVNLNRNILTFDCPCCRTAEPVMAAMKPPTQTQTADCPVCLESTECRVLSCGHNVCHSCWDSCRRSAMRVSVELDDLDLDAVETERTTRKRLFQKKRNRDASSNSNEFAENIIRQCEGASNRQALERLRWEFMVEDPALWAHRGMLGHFRDMPEEALQVVLGAVQDRKDEMDGQVFGDFGHFCAHYIAQELRNGQKYRDSVPWAELALVYVGDSDFGSKKSNVVSAYLHFSRVCLAADLPSKALRYLELGTALGNEMEDEMDAEDVEMSTELREMIRGQITAWTGTSGELTPGV